MLRVQLKRKLGTAAKAGTSHTLQKKEPLRRISGQNIAEFQPLARLYCMVARIEPDSPAWGISIEPNLLRAPL